MELRILMETDQAAILEMLTDAQIKQTYMLPDFEAQENAIPLFHRLLQLSRADDHFVRGICAEGQLVGFLNDVEIEEGTIELGYVIHPRHWGQGYATTALKLALQELPVLGYRTVLTGAFSENAASIRVMEKAGMTRIPKTEWIDYRGKRHLCIYFAATLEPSK